jgi:hypothetical protein
VFEKFGVQVSRLKEEKMDLKKGHLGVLKGLTPREALNLIQHKPHPEHCTAPIEWRATLVPLADHK